MQTFWILFAASALAAILVGSAIRLGARFRSSVKPGTIIEVGWGHGMSKGGQVKIEGVFYNVVDATGTSITVGERVA